MSDNYPYSVAALYRFAHFSDPAALQPGLLSLCQSEGVKGTLLLADEGVNGTIAGSADAIAKIVRHIRNFPDCSDLEVKYSHAEKMPFYRMKVRLKKEIVTMGVAGIDPTREVGTYLKPEEWNQLISDPDTVIIDTRNDYEVAIGSFEGAIDPRTKSFRDFPKWFRDNREKLVEGKDKPKFAMFCTGGIRCEKSTAFLKAEGIDEVYHLEGGILKYLENVPVSKSKWQGECFVFDDRVSVGHGLTLGTQISCRACRRPVSEDARNHPHFVEGISCPACHGERGDDDRARYAERQRQVELADKKGRQHIGTPVDGR